MKTRWFLLLLLSVSVSVIAFGIRPVHAVNTLVVSPYGPYYSIDAALADASDGGLIEVRGGHYTGALTVNKSVTLKGIDWPVLDGQGAGTIVTLAAPNINFEGFILRASGVEPDTNDAGITLSAPFIHVENNRLEDVLFGIYVARADDAIVRGNEVTGKSQYDTGRKGDGIRVWYSQRVIVEANHVYDTRDVVLWYASNITVRNNVIERGRYGVHLMYCNDAQIEGNRLLNNSVGIYTMSSNHSNLRNNLIRGHRGPSGYGLGFKDADNVEATNNVLVDNRAGIFLDNTPFTPQGVSRMTDNILAFNDVGVLLLPAVKGNVFSNNTFWENIEQVGIQGGTGAKNNQWQGNYWSDYKGFDGDGNGTGDMPYHAEHLFENLMDREPRLRTLMYSPVVQAIEMASSAFPIVRPQPKLTDTNPLVQPKPIPSFATAQEAKTGNLPALLLIELTVLFSIAVLIRQVMPHRKPNGVTDMPDHISSREQLSNSTTIVVKGVTKCYGKHQALHNVSFEAKSGEAIALWGANGAGKSTLLKAILGLIRFKGEICVADYNVMRQGKLTRRQIGYVPQEAVFYDWQVQETMEFYARIKKVSFARIPVLLEQLGLVEHAKKPVPALSGGLKQRLALAIALLSDPPVLLLDEPTASLDARARHDYLTLLASLRHDGKTIIFASHRIEELQALADRVVVLENGELVEITTPEAIRSKLLSDYELTLWVSDRNAALNQLLQSGLSAHLNGRGTVVVQVPAANKAYPMQLLSEQGITVLDFEMEQRQSWN